MPNMALMRFPQDAQKENKAYKDDKDDKDVRADKDVKDY